MHVGTGASYESNLHGAVGFAGPNGTPDVLLTAEQVAGIVAAAEAREEARAAKRRERIAAQHPAPRPVTYREDLAHSRAYGASTVPLPQLHRGWRAESECVNCRIERDEWAAIRRATVVQDHDAQSTPGQSRSRTAAARPLSP